MVDCRGERALNCRSMDKYLFAERIHEQFVDKVKLLLLSTHTPIIRSKRIIGAACLNDRGRQLGGYAGESLPEH